MLLQGVQNVCCCVVKLISFKLYEQNAVKQARKGFRPPSAMKGIENFLDFLGEFFGNFLGGFFLGGFF